LPDLPPSVKKEKNQAQKRVRFGLVFPQKNYKRLASKRPKGMQRVEKTLPSERVSKGMEIIKKRREIREKENGLTQPPPLSLFSPPQQPPYKPRYNNPD
jgi:hypothetical protein